jgi:hypothetical protein
LPQVFHFHSKNALFASLDISRFNGGGGKSSLVYVGLCERKYKEEEAKNSL